MAKAKKTTGGETTSAAPKARKAEPAKAADKKAPARPALPGVPGVPAVDTTLAATLAAKLVANRAKLGEAASGEAVSGAAAPAAESGAFKQLKDSLKPGAAPKLGGDALKSITGGGNMNSPFAQRKEVGHNQTFGGATRTGVPRRTNG